MTTLMDVAIKIAADAVASGEPSEIKVRKDGDRWRIRNFSTPDKQEAKDIAEFANMLVVLAFVAVMTGAGIKQ